jgi:hypothetical protein
MFFSDSESDRRPCSYCSGQVDQPPCNRRASPNDHVVVPPHRASRDRRARYRRSARPVFWWGLFVSDPEK